MVRVFISTASEQPWVVLRSGCTDTDRPTCRNDRGYLFQPNDSTSWHSQGNFSLQIEDDLGYSENGNFGYDDITLGFSPAVTMKQQIVAGIATKDIFVATWGICPASTNLTDFNHPIPSVLSNLKKEDLIPSVSWSYTAGAYHESLESGHGLGSLTFGGYDAARFIANNITFSLGPSLIRDLSIGLQSIALTESNTTTIELLSKPIVTILDAGVPFIWLPREACDNFEKTFNLTYNTALDLYLPSSTTSFSSNATLVFHIASSTIDSNIVSIILPIAALNLTLTSDFPGVSNKTHYFPIRRASNETQYTLGRTFFQHAYVIADYERQNFRVAQAVFPKSSTTDLRPILAPQPQRVILSLPVSVVLAILGVLFVLFTILGNLHYQGYCRLPFGLLSRYHNASSRSRRPSHQPKDLETSSIRDSVYENHRKSLLANGKRWSSLLIQPFELTSRTETDRMTPHWLEPAVNIEAPSHLQLRQKVMEGPRGSHEDTRSRMCILM